MCVVPFAWLCCIHVWVCGRCLEWCLLGPVFAHVPALLAARPVECIQAWMDVAQAFVSSLSSLLNDRQMRCTPCRPRFSCFCCSWSCLQQHIHAAQVCRECERSRLPPLPVAWAEGLSTTCSCCTGTWRPTCVQEEACLACPCTVSSLAMCGVLNTCASVGCTLLFPPSTALCADATEAGCCRDWQ
jgi:hypothetical protein